MRTYMRSSDFKSSNSNKPSSRGKTARSGKLPEDEIPDSPPPALRSEYLKVSWAYVYWCIGMWIWTALCDVYFVMTHQTTNMIIGIALGVLLVAMIVLPAMLFGGTTWYKRIGWMMLLLAMFSAMWVYPIVTIGFGVRKRIFEGHYHRHPTTEVIWHSALSVLTVVVSVWTLSVTWRCARLVRQLYRGEYGVTEVKVRH
jgi:hypothetical protein